MAENNNKPQVRVQVLWRVYITQEEYRYQF